MILTLPFPPSTNGLFTNRRGGRAATKQYLAWQEEAGWELMKVWHIDTPPRDKVALNFRFGKPDKRKRDLDNLLKAPIDLLVKHGVITDDRGVEYISAQWADIEGVQIQVIPE